MKKNTNIIYHKYVTNMQTYTIYINTNIIYTTNYKYTIYNKHAKTQKSYISQMYILNIQKHNKIYKIYKMKNTNIQSIKKHTKIY